jgi:NAD(P)-dependent dehydrogenase (short-subunit alcohol dehydrogenase family)
MSLKGKIALITGGVKNLGAAIALELAPTGVDLALHYNSPKSKEDALKLEAKLKEEFPSTKVIFYAADLTTATAVDNLFADVIKDFGRIDIVVNTIGMVLKKPISEISEEEYDKMFA